MADILLTQTLSDPRWELTLGENCTDRALCVFIELSELREGGREGEQYSYPGCIFLSGTPRVGTFDLHGVVARASLPLPSSSPSLPPPPSRLSRLSIHSTIFPLSHTLGIGLTMNSHSIVAHDCLHAPALLCYTWLATPTDFVKAGCVWNIKRFKCPMVTTARHPSVNSVYNDGSVNSKLPSPHSFLWMAVFEIWSFWYVWFTPQGSVGCTIDYHSAVGM